MSPAQRALCRHALGLPNDGKRSYRNRYYARAGTMQYRSWMAMCRNGLAERNRFVPGELRLFWCTRTGAALALMNNETLDKEDFPDKP